MKNLFAKVKAWFSGLSWIVAFKKWNANRRYKLAVKWITALGMVPTRIVRRGGTDYIVSGKGEFYRIGRAQRG